MYKQSRFHLSCSSSGNLSSSHIRFNSDDDDAEEQQNDGSTLSKTTDSLSEAKLSTATKGGQVESLDQTISCKDMEVKVIVNKFVFRKCCVENFVGYVKKHCHLLSCVSEMFCIIRFSRVIFNNLIYGRQSS